MASSSPSLPYPDLSPSSSSLIILLLKFDNANANAFLAQQSPEQRQGRCVKSHGLIVPIPASLSCLGCQIVLAVVPCTVWASFNSHVQNGK